MLAVANTSPLRYMIVIGQSGLLGQLYGTVLIPPGVAAELSDQGAPPLVTRWISKPPAWLKIVPLQSALDQELIANLDRGECEAIKLAEQVNANVLLMDERKGRAIAHERGLPVAGALSVLGDAYRLGLAESPYNCLPSSVRRASGSATIWLRASKSCFGRAMHVKKNELLFLRQREHVQRVPILRILHFWRQDPGHHARAAAAQAARYRDKLPSTRGERQRESLHRGAQARFP